LTSEDLLSIASARETYVPTTQQEPEAHARFPRSQEDPRWTRGPASAAREGPQAHLRHGCQEV